MTSSVHPPPLHDALFRAIVEHSPVAIWLQCSSTVLWANPAFEELTGFNAAEYVAPAFFERLVLPADAGLVELSVGDLQRDIRIVRKDGAVLWVEFRLTGPLWTSETGPVYLARAFDISARVRAEAEAETRDQLERLTARALREREQQFAGAFRSSPSAMLVTRMSDGMVLDANNVWGELFGYTHAEMVGHTTGELRMWAEQDQRPALIAGLQRGEPVRGVSAAFRRSDGEVRHGLLSLEIIERNGEPCLLASVVDISDRERVARELRQREEQFASAFRLNPSAMMVTSVPTRAILDVNRAWCEVFGFEREAVLGHRSDELGIWVRPEQREEFIEQLHHGRTIRGEALRFRRGDGAMRDGLISIEIIERGGEECLLAALTDITDRAEVERALRQREALLFTTFRSNPSPSVLSDPRTTLMVDANDAWARQSGYAREELIGHTALELGLWVDEGLRRRMGERVSAGLAVRDMEFQFRRKDGAIRDALISAEIVEIGGEQRMLSSVMDITERLQAERALQERERLLFQLFESSPAPAALTRPNNGEFVDVNDAYARQTGYTRAELIGHTPAELGLWANAETPRQLGQLVADGIEVRDVECDYRTKSGALRTALISLEDVELRGETLQLASIIDITAIRRAEEQRLALQTSLQEAQRLEALSVLAGGVAHDFNNLLVGILGNADLALMELEEHTPARESIAEAAEAARRAAKLAQQMLAYSGRGRFILSPVDLNALAREVGGTLAHLFAASPLKYELAEGLPPVQADHPQLRQLLSQLLTNAAEALDGTSGTVTVRTWLETAGATFIAAGGVPSELDSGEYVCLEVADTGQGMDAETRARIFEPFFSTKFTGRGLGLAAVLGIVRGHHGAIRVESAPGAGATFTVLLPAAPAA